MRSNRSSAPDVFTMYCILFMIFIVAQLPLVRCAFDFGGEDTTGVHEGEPDEEFDHEAITGSKHEAEEFKDLDPEEAKARLSVLVKKMDQNSDGLVEKEELKDWILHSFEKLDREEAQFKLDEHDENKNQMVTWPEFLYKNYGYRENELLELEKDMNSDMQGFIKMVKDDKEKFDLADRDKDGNLTLMEYVAFARPQNYPFMAPHEVKRSLEDFDKDHNGYLDVDEFIGEHTYDNDTIEAEKAHFKQYDLNGDGQLDAEELKPWVVPGFDKTAQQEVEHLFRETDQNKDGKLSMNEILDMHELWVGSHATDYGKHLDDLRKDEL